MSPPELSPLPAYSAVVATYERPEDLRRLLESLAQQTHRPEAIVVVDSSPAPATAEVVGSFAQSLPVKYERALKPSAAVQRNQGAAQVTTPLVMFVDDDAILSPTLGATICEAFAQDKEARVGGVAARIDGMQHSRPRGLLRLYYRLQAGYDDPTYGGKLFGAAINVLPTYEEGSGPLIPAEWLNSTCVVYRTAVFQREQFPQFAGYSALEDVHVSGRIGKTHQLFFHRDAHFIHNDAPSDFKRNAKGMARMRIRNQRIVAREVQGLDSLTIEWKVLLHRLFVTANLLRARPRSWKAELLGLWTS